MFLKFFGKKKSADSVSKSDGQLVHGIDPEMNYCPDCEDEFRGDIVKCPTCNVALMTGEEKIECKIAENKESSLRTMDICSDDELVSIRKAPLKDVKALQRILANERIPSILAGDGGGKG